MEEEEEYGSNEQSAQVDTLLQQHQAQLAHLTDKLEEDKERQARLLQEKIEAKKIRKERWVCVGGCGWTQLVQTN